MNAYLTALKHEFLAEENSFLLKLRAEFEWDKEAFSRLITAMKECCEEYEGKDMVERWLAEGFWYLAFFVRDHTMHPSFPRVYSENYFEEAFRRLEDLADWFFTGQRPYIDKHRPDSL